MPGNLASLNILLTRQTDSNRSLHTQINAIGGSCVELPLFAIESLIDQKYLEQLQAKFKQCDLAICISRNAAQLTLQHLQPISDVMWATIGPSTARYLQKSGVSKVLFPTAIPYDSQALLQIIIAHNINLEKKYIIVLTGEDVAGEIGDAWLPNALTQLGANVELAPVYRRIKPAISSDQLLNIFSKTPRIDITLITCVTSLVNLIELTNFTPLEIHKIPLLVVSKRIYDYAVAHGFTSVHTADGMSDAAIISALYKWR